MGGGSPEQTTNEFKPPSWTADQWPEFVRRGAEISQRYATDPNLIYGNNGQPMVAQMSDLQNRAANGIYGMASAGSQGEQLSNQYLSNLLNGKQQNIQPSNEYMGNSPQFEAMLQAQNKGITDSFARGTMARQASEAARAGAFGGSADMELQGIMGGELAAQIAANEATQRNAQFERSAGLRENEINRGWQGWENAAGRQMQGIGLIQQGDQNKLNQWLATMGAGDLQRLIESENIGAAMNLFNANVQQPISALDLFGSVLQRASGQGGSQTTTMPGQNPLMGLLGAGMAGYGMMGG